jgi:ankyrin repeat protein
LHIACSADCKKLRVHESAAVRIADLLLDRGIDIESYVLDRSCDARCTPLFFAVARGRNTSLIKHLLKRGASVRNSPGGCLFAAGWYDDVKHLDLLLCAGADIDPVVGGTPFLACWTWKKFEAAKFLASKGANINYQEPKKGRTALHLGIEKEYDPALLKWLVQHGASPDIKDKEGVTARERASRKRDKKWLRPLG